MRTTINCLEFDLSFHPKGEVPAPVQMSERALKTLEMIAAFGMLLSAGPEDLTSPDHWQDDHAQQKYARQGVALHRLGELITAMADGAYSDVAELSKLIEH